MADKPKILKFHKQFHLNIGLLIILIIFIYIFFHVFSYFTKKKVSIYEVKIGQIVKNNHYAALAIRQETVVNTDSDGIPFYYVVNGSRVGMRTNVFAMDKSGELSKKLTNESIDISSVSNDNLYKFAKLVSAFSDGYNNTNFMSVYSFKNDLTDQIDTIYHQEAEKNLQNEIQSAIAAGTYNIYKPPTPGYLLYSLDGYEGTTLENYKDIINNSNDNKTRDLRVNSKIKAGEPIYKLITSDDWNLIMKISDQTANDLKEKSYINIRFDYDNTEASCACQIEKSGDTNYLILSLDDSMERFASTRYVDIELLINQEKGLKIPNSAIVKHDFYAIPKEYFFRGNDSAKLGVMAKNEAQYKNTFTPLSIYNSKDDMYYVDVDDLKGVSEIFLPDTLATYDLSKHRKTLKGVYNVNKGYATFSVINVLYKSEDYSIIDKSTTYGITQYDHIALDGNSISNGQIIY